MSRNLYLKYSEAQNLLQEGDVLLFAGSGLISAMIKVAGVGEYSHVAVASKSRDMWEAVEYREWYGGRAVNLENYIRNSKQQKTRIDVYRPAPQISHLHFNVTLNEVEYKTCPFDGFKITECMRKLTGLPYSYRRLWLIFRLKLFKWRILTDVEKITRECPTDEPLYPVCSTVVSHCFLKCGWPLLKRRSDEFMEPSHVALSPRLNYLFTLDID